MAVLVTAWMPSFIEEHAEQLLGAGQPADAEVAQERLGGDIGERARLRSPALRSR